MIRVDVEQGSPEWIKARLGLPTASGFSKLVTPGGKASSQASGYLNLLAAEWLLGRPVELFTSAWAERGTELEPQARAFYEMETGLKVERVGLILRDDGLAGCSPDGLVGDGLVELKCPAPQTHVGYLLAGELPVDYRPQVQGQMLITGAPWVDFLSYHPDLPPFLIRVDRDEKYIALLSGELERLIEDLAAAKDRLAKYKA